MKARPGTLLLVEGHCDECGTAEYNISLGDRRAKATANYLTSRAVASDRMTMISYGEQRPSVANMLNHAGAEPARTFSRERRMSFLEPGPLAEIALWIALAFAMWLGLIAALNRLGVHASPIISAPISWVLARAVMSGVPELVHWAQHTVMTVTG